MKTAWVGLGLGLALALQTTLAPMLADVGVPVDLVLVVVVTAAVAGGPVAGLAAGTVGGLLQDALSGGVIGVGGLAKTLVGFLVGQFASRFLIARSWHQVLVFFVASVVHAGCFLGVYSLLSNEGTLTSYGAVLTQATANAAIGVTLAVALHAGPGVIERRRLRRRSLSSRFGG
jgi:rod shape-determining protein MreD